MVDEQLERQRRMRAPGRAAVEAAKADGRWTAAYAASSVAEVPEAKTVKNRIHWDVDVADLQPLLDHGATVLREPDDQIRWAVLADPEGNEFCAFLPRG